MATEDSTTPTRVPAVAVVVPAYRVEDYVVDTLRSVQRQTMPDWECVVVEDGSPDDTAARVAEIAVDDARIRLVRQANTGLSGARNTGLAHVSEGVRYVAFLDSDDLWREDALEHLLAALEADPAAVGAYGYAEFVDEHGEPFASGLHSGRQRQRRRLVGRLVRPVAEHEPVRFDELVVGNPVWPPAVALHRREVVDEVGPFDTTLKQCEDVDFMLRMARHGPYVATARQVAWYRQHGGQMTTRRAEFWYAHDMVRRKSWESELNTPEQRRDVARAWRVAQVRRLVRCSLRLGSAVRHGRWPDARRLAHGWAVLVVQLIGSVPPVARLEHVHLAGRDV